MIVDEMHEEHPELLKDQYWDEVVPKDLPYTVASEQYRREEPKGSAEHYKVKDSDALYANVILGPQIHNHVQHRKTHQDDMYADYVSTRHQMNLKLSMCNRLPVFGVTIGSCSKHVGKIFIPEKYLYLIYLYSFTYIIGKRRYSVGRAKEKLATTTNH